MGNARVYKSFLVIDGASARCRQNRTSVTRAVGFAAGEPLYLHNRHAECEARSGAERSGVPSAERQDCGAERAPRAAREAECEPISIRTTTEASAESRFGAGGRRERRTGGRKRAYRSGADPYSSPASYGALSMRSGVRQLVAGTYRRGAHA